jgi:hypothetical protein
MQGLGDPEVDHLHHRPIIVQRHQYVRRLDVAVDDSLLMGVLQTRCAAPHERLRLFVDVCNAVR